MRPRISACDNQSEFKCNARKLLKKHNADIQRTKTKYKHTREGGLCGGL